MIKTINNLANIYDNLFWSAYSFFCTNFMKINCLVRGVQIIKGKFFGLMTFKKARNSNIIIGSNCTFRSSYSSNLIGVNRKCIITSMGANSLLSIGDNCGFSGTVIGCFQKITLENNVKCGANTLITDSDWHLDDPRAGALRSIKICKNV